MAINLTKGQRVDIGLQKLGVGLGWDPNSSSTSHDFDLDASAFMLGADGQVPNEAFFVFYGNQASGDGSVKSSGDDQTGGNSAGDDDQRGEFAADEERREAAAQAKGSWGLWGSG